MDIELRSFRMLLAATLSLVIGGQLQAANTPTVNEALSFQPLQKEVQYDKPEGTEIARCTIKAEKVAGKTGWVVRDSSGQMLRNFVDTNADNMVDQWSYYKDGVEVYRDIDSNFNRKVDQCRWMNMAGTRWGLDLNEDTKIDQWKVISAEEVTAELVAALRDRDRYRFERLLVNPKEIKTLGLGKAKAEQLQTKVEAALAGFVKLAGTQKLVNGASKWVSFAGNQPCLIPAGTEDSTTDMDVYENVMAMVETEGKALPLSVGSMAKVKDAWRLIDLPQVNESAAEHESRPFWFALPRGERNEQTGAPIGKPNEKVQALMKELQQMKDITAETKPEEHIRRAELTESIAKESDPDMRNSWYRQLTDTLSASIQTGNFPEGIERLKKLQEALKADPKDDELAFYAQFRLLSAEHAQALAAQNAPFANIQTKWIDDLKSFIEAGKKYPDSAEAVMELAIAQEFGGDETEASKWYETLVKDYPSSPLHRKAEGARLRLNCVGKSIPLQGKLLQGGSFDLAKLQGKVVLIQYWATWCEPCKADVPLLKELRAKFKGNFEVVGVCLDNDKEAVNAFLKESDQKWPQLFEDGGLESRYAVSMGVQTLPMMILIDQQGKVVNRSVRGESLGGELKKLLK